MSQKIIRFQVYDKGAPVESLAVRNAHLIGADHSAMRADISFREGQLVCIKREQGSASLAMQQASGDCGELTLATTLLPERDEPYLLSLEQARHRLMMVYNKIEDWGMFDRGDDESFVSKFDAIRQLFIDALCCQGTDTAKADELAKQCLSQAIIASEELALFHADMLLSRRKAAGVISKFPLGSGIALNQTAEPVRAALLSNFDFLALPVPWRELAIAEGEYRWENVDQWVDWASRSRMPMMGGPLVSFSPAHLPDWLYIWEHDYETLRDLIYEHVERVVQRYRNHIRVWTIASGLHINGQFNLNFDQLMDLTRMSAMLVKKVQPNSKVLVGIRQPFGEYYGKNQRSIPPLMYCDLLVQGGVHFDGFVLELPMGQALPGQYTRDLLQISNLLDQFSVFGKPVNVVLGAPSETVQDHMIAPVEGSAPVDANSGYWRRPWSQGTQAAWLTAVMSIVMSKPFVETVIWRDLMDHAEIELPLSGLVGEDMKPKKAFKAIADFRRSLQEPPGARDHRASEADRKTAVLEKLPKLERRDKA